MALLGMVRLFTGPGWQPAEIGLTSRHPPGPYIRAQLSDTRILTAQQVGYISLDHSLLSLPPFNKEVTWPIQHKRSSVSGGNMAKNQEAAINRQVGRLLRQGSIDRDEFEAKVAEIAAQYGDEVYCALLYTAAHLEFGTRAAKNHLQKILQHWNSLCSDTRRDVDFRVALLDYFLTINRCIRNPKIIEVKIFEKTQQETEIDDLTQLHNFRYFSKAIELEVCRSSRYHAPLSLVLFDADDFKFYNDTNGHLAGNKALKKLAGIIRKSVREVDIAARFGGEEFALLLPETNKEGAFTIADRICRAVERAAFPNCKSQPRQTIHGEWWHCDPARRCKRCLDADKESGPGTVPGQGAWKKPGRTLYRGIA